MTMLSKLHRILLGAALAVGSATVLTGVARADADLALTLAPPSETVIHYGETIDFDATVVNLGLGTSVGAQITGVTVPAGFTVASISNCKAPDDATSPFPCTLTSAGAVTPGQIFAELDPVNPQYAVTATITVELPVPMKPGPNPGDDPVPDLPTVCPDLAPLSIQVTIGSTSVDPVAANDSADSAGFAIGTFADLSVEMEAPEKVGYGDTFDVKVTVTNVGACTATDVVADDMDNSIGWLTAGYLEFEGATGACDKDPRAESCTWDSLEPGDEVTWTITYRQTGFPSGLTSSSSWVAVYARSLAEGAFDPDDSNDQALTATYSSRSQSGCSTGDMGGVLSLLALGLPFLRRRRKS